MSLSISVKLSDQGRHMHATFFPKDPTPQAGVLLGRLRSRPEVCAVLWKGQEDPTLLHIDHLQIDLTGPQEIEEFRHVEIKYKRGDAA